MSDKVTGSAIHPADGGVVEVHVPAGADRLYLGVTGRDDHGHAVVSLATLTAAEALALSELLYHASASLPVTFILPGADGGAS